jgi:hypothetical protein
LSVKLSDITVLLSRTAHSAGWDADISVQTREGARQCHCPGHRFVTAEIKELVVKRIMQFILTTVYSQATHIYCWCIIPFGVMQTCIL